MPLLMILDHVEYMVHTVHVIGRSDRTSRVLSVTLSCKALLEVYTLRERSMWGPARMGETHFDGAVYTHPTPV